MEKIVVTGAEGFFASRFIKYYENKYKISGFNRRDLDITDKDKVFQILKEFMPNYVIHTAAIADTKMCEKNPELSYSINVKGTENIANACKDLGIKLIFLSSEQVYNGNEEEGPYKEEEAIPNTIYGKHKLEAENIILNMEIDSVILRLTWLFGLPERGLKINSNILWNVLKATINNLPLALPANEYRGMTYVYDLLEVFDKIIKLPTGIYNIGSYNELRTYDIGEIVLRELNLGHRTKEILIKDEIKYSNKCRDLRTNNSKIEGYGIGFMSTEEAIVKCIKEYTLY